jgi:ferrochelatase
MEMKRWGLMLLNLGTPDSTDVPDVRRYLREFLSDPRVLDINPINRWLLLNLVILRSRPKESSEAYRTIWTDAGSPLLVHGLALRENVQALYGNTVLVTLAMRYQNPSISAALAQFKAEGIDNIAICPLFPQYASASTGSAVEKVFSEAGRLWNVPNIHIVPPFFDHPDFIRAFTEVTQPVIEAFTPERVVMSFHGLPERHCIKSDEVGGHCLQTAHCCEQMVKANRNCYRAQCFATAKALTASLNLSPEEVIITFQSRLGRDPWIKPYTDDVINGLAEEGIKRVAVMCPAFVADCLETLEEIAIRADEDFRKRGGEKLLLVPSLNSTDTWSSAVKSIVGTPF